MKRYILQVKRSNGSSSTWDMSEQDFNDWREMVEAAGFTHQQDPRNPNGGILTALGRDEYKYAVRGTDGILDLQRGLDELLPM